jgi:1-acyl-sn-glycerol-3-phosphate acyltransferase
MTQDKSALADIPPPYKNQTVSFFGKLAKAKNVIACVLGHNRGIAAINRKHGKLWTLEAQEQYQKTARFALDSLGVKYTAANVPAMDKPLLLVGNHTSYIDIMMVVAHKPTVFVAKKEMASWPLLGKSCKNVATVFVDRSSKKSRAETAGKIAEAVTKEGKTLSLFPSGTTLMHASGRFQRGAFKIAEQYGVPITPFRITYSPLRLGAYLKTDTIVSHIWNLLGHDELEAHIEFGEETPITDFAAQTKEIGRWCESVYPA